MASVACDPGGLKRVLFVAPDGRRVPIRLGRMPKRDAETICGHIEHLLTAKLSGQAVDPYTARWLGEIDVRLHRKLAKHRLTAPRADAASVKLGPFLTEYVDSRADLKPATKIVRGQIVRELTEFLGEARDVRTVAAGDADDFKQFLIGRKLAPTTIHKRLQVARSFFHAMRRRKLIDENPFDGVSMAAAGIKDRQRFVTREETALVLAKCPSIDWRVIVALARFGGLRTPSETLSLKWTDIDWENSRINVPSCKTEHHAGKASRMIPLFPELRPILAEAFDLAPDGAEFVVDAKFRKAALGPGVWLNTNLRTTFQKIVRRAGLQAWPRLFHNLRASRETELVESYPVQVVTGWLGNTPAVAMRHYLMTTSEHFARAVAGDNPAVAETAQKTAQHSARQGETAVNSVPAENENSPESQGCSTVLPLVYKCQFERAEPSSSAPQVRARDTPCVALGITRAEHRIYGLASESAAFASSMASKA